MSDRCIQSIAFKIKPGSLGELEAVEARGAAETHAAVQGLGDRSLDLVGAR